MTATHPPRHANNFDALRLGLALLVLYSHSFALLHGEEHVGTVEPFYRLTHGQIGGGGLAVAGFFVLSGYLVAQSWGRSRGLRDYAGKRARRILPGYLVAALVSLLLVPALVGVSPFASRPPLDYALLIGVLQFPLVRGLFPDNPIPHAANGSLWTIRYEVGCYALLALIGLCGLRRRRWLILPPLAVALGSVVLQVLGVLALPAGGWLALPSWLLGEPRWYAMFAPYFLAGAAAALYRDRLPRSRAWCLAALAPLVAATVSGFGLGALLPVCGTYLLLYAGEGRWAPLSRLTARVDLSYGVYLYAFPVQQLLVHHWGQQLTGHTLFLLATPMTCALAWLSWHGVERRFLRRAVPVASAPATHVSPLMRTAQPT